MKKTQKQLGSYIHTLRKYLNLTQAQFAAQYEISVSTLSKIERGIIPPPLEFISFFVYVLRVSSVLKTDEARAVYANLVKTICAAVPYLYSYTEIHNYWQSTPPRERMKANPQVFGQHL